MVSRARYFGWLRAGVAAIVWALCGNLSAAQDRRLYTVEVPGEQQPTIAATSNAPVVPASADAVIDEMSRAAGVIFVGQVTAVRRPVAFGMDASGGIVEVDFRVDQAVRGPANGSVYTLREWSGLWNASGVASRYRTGQRLLVFLYQPDEHGLSSPVHGRDGVLPLRGGGMAPGPDETASGPAQWMVDLRWVQARALQGSSVVMPPVRRPMLPRPVRGFAPDESELQGEVDSRSDLVRRQPVGVPALTTTTLTVATEPLTQVLALCQQAVGRVDAAR